MSAPTGVAQLPFAALRDDQPPRPGAPGESAALSDAQLIALARESAHEAFELIYATYKGRIYLFLLRMLGEPEAADDVTQDVFTKALRALPTFDRDHRLLPWLYTVANNAGLDRIRRHRRLTWLRLGNLAGRDEPHAADGHGQVGEREHVQAVLRKLPPENAAALLLHALEGYSYREIAEIQGATLTAVRSRIARARHAFRQGYDAVNSPGGTPNSAGGSPNSPGRTPNSRGGTPTK